MGDEGKLDFRLVGNKTVKLALFWAADFFGTRDQGVMAMTRTMLQEHGMNLECWPASGLKTPDRTFDFGPGVITPAKYADIFSRLNDICSGAGKQTTHLITVFCQFQMTANGLTITDTPMRCLIRPMVFIAPTPSGGDMVTLLHEIGHASGLDHDRTSTAPTGRNFMNEAEARSTMMKWQLQKLNSAFFVS
jgi:hypothetical protein